MKILKTDKQQILSFFKNAYPFTIIVDRYNGAYSGGEFLAFPLTYNEMPSEPEESDIHCCQFWDNMDCLDYFIGKGNTIERAVNDLIHKYDHQYQLLGGLPEDVCGILGHDLQYNFPSTPTRAHCLRCGKKFRADYSGNILYDDIWKEI